MLIDIFSQVLQHMRVLQEQADRAREKRLLREKGGFWNHILLINTNSGFFSKRDRNLNRSILATRLVIAFNF